MLYANAANSVVSFKLSIVGNDHYKKFALNNDIGRSQYRKYENG